jgi:transcriptional regulator with XRE-family HTH domain
MKRPDEGLNAAMAAEIRAERAAKGITIVDLAAQVGISKTKMLHILKPSIDIDVPDLAALGAVFDLEPHELMIRAQDRLKRES